MKHFLMITLFLSFLRSNSQSMTYGQLYNYDVGDIIQSAIGAPTTYSTITILNKLSTPNNDSLIYTIQRHRYTLPACQTCSPTNITDTIVQVVTKLNTAIPNANSTNCRPTVDTLYVESKYCNRLIYQVSPKSVPVPCYHPNSEVSDFVEGVGYFYSKYIGGSGYLLTCQFIYYSKQSGTCGTPFYTAMQALSNELILGKLYPNPSGGIMYVESKSNLLYYDVFDVYGKLCKSDFITENQINIVDLRPGIYFMQVHSSDLKIKTAKIIKE